MTWETALPQLKTDPRFKSSLPISAQIHFFHSHISQLRTKHTANLHALFESHSPTLATAFHELPLSSLLSSLPSTKLGYSERDLESEYGRWQRERQTEARQAFDDMLRENSFIEFWGRLAKIGGEGVGGGVSTLR